MNRERWTIPLLLFAVLLAGSVGAWFALEKATRAGRVDDASSSEGPESNAPRYEDARPSEDAPIRREPEQVASSPPVPADAASAPPLPVLPADRQLCDLAAVVVDYGGRAIGQVEVRLRSTLGGFEPGLEIGDDRAVDRALVTDREGRVLFQRVPEGPFRLFAQAPDGRHGREDGVACSTSGRAPVRIDLLPAEPDRELALLVIGRGGEPVPGAVVEVRGSWPGHGVLGSARLPALAGTTDAEGRLAFPGVELQMIVVLARAPDGRVGAILSPNADDFEYDRHERAWRRVVVAAPATLTGQLVGVAPELTHGATFHADLRTHVLAHNSSWGRAFKTSVDRGDFRIEGLPAGNYALRLEPLGNARLVVPPLDFGGPLENSAQPPTVDLAAGETKSIELAVAPGATIRGRVLAPDGAPVEGALVKETFAPLTSNFPDGFVLHGVNVWRFDSDNELADEHPFAHRVAHTNERGEYSLAGLQPGRHRIVATAPGRSLDRREGVAAGVGETVELDLVLETAGAIQGVSFSDGYLGITRADATEPFAIAILPRTGAFTFAGLPADEYVLAQFHSDWSVAPVELARARVQAGRTTWIDLTEVPSPHPLRGRVVDAHGPVAGARVGFGAARWKTGADGRFEAPFAFQFGSQVELRLEVDGVRFLCPVDPYAPTSSGASDVEITLGNEEIEVEVGSDSERGAALEGAIVIQSGFYAFPGHRRVEMTLIPFGSSGTREPLTIRRLDAGSYRVEARYANGAARCEMVTLPRPAGSPPIDLKALPCGEIELIVRDARGRPVSGCMVDVVAWLGEGEMPRELDASGSDVRIAWTDGYTGGGGRFVARGVRAGPVRVRATGTEIAHLGERAPEARLVLRAGEKRRVELTLP